MDQIDFESLRTSCIEKLSGSQGRVSELSGFLGFDGFIDEIIHVVDKRENAKDYTRLGTIEEFAKRVLGAAGRSSNIELVTQRTKIGGNGPIMANALATFGVNVTYIGALGYPDLQPVFHQFAKNVTTHSIAEAAHTDAYEFNDGKILFGRLTLLEAVNWTNIKDRFGTTEFMKNLSGSDLIGFVNWTMIPHMSEIWSSIKSELCHTLTGPKRTLFFDLCDPAKRLDEDIKRAVELILEFEPYFNVILGLNEKEAYEIGRTLGLQTDQRTEDSLISLASEIHRCLPVSTLVVHPVSFALTVSKGSVCRVAAPITLTPKISTGAGDHFNAGFCLGKLLGFDNSLSLLTGISSSGFYVRNAKSPELHDLIKQLQSWESVSP